MGLESVVSAARALPLPAAVLLRAALAGTAVLGPAFLAAAFFRKRPAHAHAVLFTGILGFPLAAAFAFLPKLPLPILPPALGIGVEIEASRELPDASDFMTRARGLNDGPLRPDFILIPEALWAAGAAAGLGRLARQRAALKRLISRSTLLTDPRLLEETALAASALGLSSPPELRECGTLSVPLACGVRGPSIILPRDFGSRVKRAALRGILRHEAAHITRRDNLTDAIVRVTAAVFWFQPLIRVAAKKMRELRERACDAAAVAGERDPLVYARALIEFARSRTDPFPVPGIVDGRDGFRELRKRIAGIIESRQARKDDMRHKRLSFAVPVTALLLFSLLLSGASPVPVDAGNRKGASSASADLPAFRWPLRIAGEGVRREDFRISLSFGNTGHPVTKKPYHHDGIDITVAAMRWLEGRRVEVTAAADGRVLDAGFDGTRGNFVLVGHAGNSTTLYCKLDAPTAARIGDLVASGQVLGFMGSTGVSTGPHLHFEVRIDGEPVDPLDYLPMP